MKCEGMLRDFWRREQEVRRQLLERGRRTPNSPAEVMELLELPDARARIPNDGPPYTGANFFEWLDCGSRRLSPE